MAKSFYNIRPDGGGGGGAVDSVNGQTGTVVLTKSSIGLNNVDNTSDLNKPISTATQAALDLKADLTDLTGTANRLTRFDSLGELNDVSQLEVNDSGYITSNLTVEPDANTGFFELNRSNVTISPLDNSPNETWNLNNNQVNVDPSSSGYTFGTGGQAFRFDVNNVNHDGTSDIGSIEFIQNNFGLGNGIDPIDVNGFGYIFGFGQVNPNVTIVGPIQGYGFQPNVNSAANISTSTYIQAFYDNVNIGCASPSYTSFNASPSIESINNNNNYQGINVNPTITTLTGNAGVIGLGIYGNYGTFNTNGYFNGVNVNPTISSARYAAGLNVSMDNVTVYAGVAASLVIQDLTIAADLPGTTGNTVTIEYTAGGTAGAEVVTNTGVAFSVQIEDGVSTAQNIADALNGYVPFTINLNVTISGTASNPQNIQSATNLTGGIDPGSKRAAYLDGDVEITGSLSFGGALSIGQLNAFYNQELANGSGNPVSIHSLISSVYIDDNDSVTVADTLGINTAMLVSIGQNATVTTGFTGLSALALPAVVTMESGSTVDRMAGSTFAISLDASATGGTIDILDLCRSIAIPNGATTITKLAGYKFDLPFGDPGTTSWGFYESPGVNNYFAGNLLIGGTAGSDDTVSNSNCALEIKSTTKSLRVSQMTSTQRDAMTPLAGMIIFNTTTSTLQYYDGSTWV